MSKFVTKDHVCPLCGKRNTIEIWNKIVIDTMPQMMERIIENTINVFHCEACGREIMNSRLPYTVLSQKHQLAILYYPFDYNRHLIFALDDDGSPDGFEYLRYVCQRR